MKNEYLVGTYSLGFRGIRLCVRTDSANGCVELIPKDAGATRIIIGINSWWGEAFGVLLHELYECTLIDLNTRYKCQPSFSSESSDFMFFLSHNELGEAHERIGEFFAAALPPFMAAYKKYSPYKD